MAGVVLDQVNLSIAAFEDGVMGDVAPFVIAGPAGDSLGDVAGQEFAAAHTIHMVVPGMVFSEVVELAKPLWIGSNFFLTLSLPYKCLNYCTLHL